MYSKKFTLQDLFYNPYMKDVLPQAKVKTQKIEYEKGGETLSKRVPVKFSLDDYIDQIIRIATRTARKTMKNVKGKPTSAYMVALIDGTLRKGYSITNTYNDVLMALKNQAFMVSFFHSNKEEIEKALLHPNNDNFKLYLRINSLDEIKSFDRMQMGKFLKDVAENLYFNDNFIYANEKPYKAMFIKNARNQMSSWQTLHKEFYRKVGIK